MKATDTVIMRVPPVKKAIWKAAAARREMSLSAFVSMAVDAAASARPVFQPEELDVLDSLREQLRRAGINLNTLLRLVHSGEVPGSADWHGPDLAEIKGELADTLGRVREALQTKV